MENSKEIRLIRNGPDKNGDCGAPIKNESWFIPGDRTALVSLNGAVLRRIK